MQIYSKINTLVDFIDLAEGLSEIIKMNNVNSTTEQYWTKRFSFIDCYEWCYKDQ